MAKAKLEVQIIGDASSLQRALRSAGSSADGFGSKFAKAGKVVGVAALGLGAAVAGGLVVTLKRGFDELADSQKVLAQTGAVLKSTGGTANVTAKQVDSLSTSLSQMSGVDDEVIAAGENMLLTFTNIRNEAGRGNDVFTQSTKTLLDMSTALGTDMNKSAIQLGKALNDPIKGITALTRVGVTFDAGQKKQIASMVAAGNTMGAQKLILAELNKEFGGSAKAFGETMPGQLAKARNAFDEMAGNLATKFLPILTSLLAWVNSNWASISAVFDAVGRAIIASFAAIGTAVTYLRGQWEIHRNTAIATWQAIQNAVAVSIAWFKANIIPPILAIVAASREAWDRFGASIKIALGLALTTVKTFLQNMLSPFKIFFALLRGDWSAAWNELKALVSRTLSGIVSVIRGAIGLWLSAAQALGKAILDGIGAALAGLLGKVTSAFSSVWTTLAGWPGKAYSMALAIGASIMQGLWDGIKSIPGKIGGAIGGAVRGAIDKGRNSVGSTAAEYAARTIGKDIPDGILLGYLAGMAQLPTKIADKIRATIDAAAAVVRAQQGKMSAAFARMASDAFAAFDAATDAGLAKIDAKLSARLAAIAAKLSAALSKIGATQGAETPAEKKLRELDAAEAKRQRDEALAQAKGTLGNAEAGVGFEPKEGETPEEAVARVKAQGVAIAAAKEEVRLAELAITRAGLAEDARLEREAADAKAEKARKWREDLAEKAQKFQSLKTERAKLEQQAERDLDKRHLEDWLAQKEAQLLKHPELWTKIHKQLMKKFKDEFGPDFKTAGENLGRAFARGLTESLGAMESAAEKLAELIAKYLKTASPSEKGPLSTLDKWLKPFAKTYLSGLDAKLIERTFAGLPGGPALMVGGRGAGVGSASGAGFGGGGGIHIHVAGSIISEGNLIDAVQRGLVRKSRNSGELFTRTVGVRV